MSGLLTGPPMPYNTNPVFLSFRGTDVRESFIRDLEKALREAGLNPFLDERDIQIGVIDKRIEQGIDTSKGYVVVFSRDYASSKYCLDELERIMKLHEGEYFGNFHRFVIPVFYLVRTEDVRYQIGPYAEAFAALQRQYPIDKVGRWRKAFMDAADCVGVKLKNEEDSESCIKGIVERINIELKRDVHQPVQPLSNNDLLVLIYRLILVFTFLTLLVNLLRPETNPVYFVLRPIGAFVLLLMFLKFWDSKTMLDFLSKF